MPKASLTTHYKHSAVEIGKENQRNHKRTRGFGTAAGFAGRRTDTETFYAFTSFTTPATVYRYDVQTGRSTVFRQPKVDFQPSAFETRQVFYTSKDGKIGRAHV